MSLVNDGSDAIGYGQPHAVGGRDPPPSRNGESPGQWRQVRRDLLRWSADTDLAPHLRGKPSKALWLNAFRSPSPGAPLSMSRVIELANFVWPPKSHPTFITSKLIEVVCPGTCSLPQVPQGLELLCPEAWLHSLLYACGCKAVGVCAEERSNLLPRGFTRGVVDEDLEQQAAACPGVREYQSHRLPVGVRTPCHEVHQREKVANRKLEN
eukprot:2268168-Amphidinium_carterae.1